MHKMISLYFWKFNAFLTILGLSLQTEAITDIVRDPNGDFFTVKSDDCQINGCDQNERYAQTIKASDNQCRCQCSHSHPVIRDDSKECVNQLECSLVHFIRPLLTEHIPVVSLPVSPGQLIHPGAHLILAGDEKSMNHSKQMLCQIDGSDVMTSKGWQTIRLSEGLHAFELFEDGNHTFLQWIANDSLRKSLHQKLVLIRLYCSTADSSVETPCIAIRVGWVPGLRLFNERELFDQNKTIDNQGTNYSMIGLCLGLLGVMYVSALLVYMRSKDTEDIKYEERQTTRRWPSDSAQSHINAGLTTTDILSNAKDIRTNFRTSPENDSFKMSEESDKRLTPTDWTPNIPSIDYNTSDSEDSQNNLDVSQNGDALNDSTEFQSCAKESPIYEKRLQKPDRIPRHCLRISPELFEPQLLLDPPPPALEMLHKIRDLISIAKTRLRNFRYRPTLVVIPEDDYFYNENKYVISNEIMNSQLGVVMESVSTASFAANDHTIEINDENNSIITTASDINRKDIRETNLENIVNTNPNNQLIESQSFELSDKDNELELKSFSRKQILNNLKLSNIHNINDLNIDEKSNNICEKVIEVQNLELENQSFQTNIYSDIQTLKAISTKVERDLYKNFEKQVSNEKQSNETSDKTMFSYFRNSLGRFASKSKSKTDQVFVSSNNWTLQSASAARKTRTTNQKSVIRKRMTSRRGQLCYNCSDVSSLSGQQLADAYNDFEHKPSLESNENNESMDSFDCCAYSDSEMSTTSSTIRDNQLTSLESELNDNTSYNDITDNGVEENSRIDECLKYLAAASVDDNHDKYYQRIGRASKNMSALKQLNSGQWTHVCHRSDSELEISEKKSDSRTSFYSKNSKSRIKSSKSLNSNNRQKFKKKLALYKSQTNNVLNRNDNQTSPATNCCLTETEQSSSGFTDNNCVNILNNFDSNSVGNDFESTVDFEESEEMSEHFVIKIKI